MDGHASHADTPAANGATTPKAETCSPPPLPPLDVPAPPPQDDETGPQSQDMSTTTNAVTESSSASSRDTGGRKMPESQHGSHDTPDLVEIAQQQKGKRKARAGDNEEEEEEEKETIRENGREKRTDQKQVRVQDSIKQADDVPKQAVAAGRSRAGADADDDAGRDDGGQEQNQGQRDASEDGLLVEGVDRIGKEGESMGSSVAASLRDVKQSSPVRGLWGHDVIEVDPAYM